MLSDEKEEKNVRAALKAVFFLLFAFVFSSCTAGQREKRGKVYIVASGLAYGGGVGIGELGAGSVMDILELETGYKKLLESRNIDFSEYFLIDYSPNGTKDYNDFQAEAGEKIENSKFPTKENVINALERTAEEASGNDLIVFMYSGHGQNNGSLCFYDSILSAAEKPQYISSTSGLSPAELADVFSETEAQVLVVLDSCYSGNFGITSDAGEYGEEVKEITSDDVPFDVNSSAGIFGKLLKLPNVTVLMANSKKYESLSLSGYGTPWTQAEEMHGLFMGHLITYFGIEHSSSDVLRTFSAEELGMKQNVVCHGKYREPGIKKLYVSSLMKKVKRDIKTVMKNIDAEYPNEFHQDAFVSCSPRDLLICY